MGKKIPLKITPDTIITAFFEIRFRPAVKEELMPLLYPILIKDYPKMAPKKHPIPAEFRGLDPNLRYLADYTFSNDVFSISLGNNVLVFEYVSAYTGWKDFYHNIEKVLQATHEEPWFSKTERLGLRYINIIEGNETIESTLDFPLKLNLENVVAKNRVFISEFVNDTIAVKTTIAESGTIRREKEVRKGISIDIDVSRTQDLAAIGVDLLPVITALHDQEKFVFFNILKQEFIDSRNPQYAS